MRYAPNDRRARGAREKETGLLIPSGKSASVYRWIEVTIAIRLFGLSCGSSETVPGPKSVPGKLRRASLVSRRIGNLKIHMDDYRVYQS